MKKLFTLIISILFLSNCVKFKTADLVIHNARIYTVNEEFEVAQAMAIKDGKIVMIGKEHEIMNKYRADELIDAETKPIYPGFMDAHCHFLGSGLNSLAVDLKKVRDIKEFLLKLHDYRESNAEMKWLIGYGWDENNWNFSTSQAFEALNKTYPNLPVLLWRVDGHSLLVNYKALDYTGIKFETFDGIISEGLIPTFTKAIQYTEAQKKQGLRFAEKNFLSKGVTTVSDAGLTVPEVKLIRTMQQSGVLDMNVYGMLYASDAALAFDTIWEDKLTVNAIKVVLDGSVGSQSACFKQPYLGTNNYGKLLMTRDSFRKIAQRVYDKGMQLNVHCIGDSAVKVALEEMGKILKETNGLGWRIEHAQCVDESEMELFAKYSIIPSVQPTHLVDDQKMAIKNLNQEQLKISYRLKSLLETIHTIPLGTDYPVASNNPIHTFYNAVYRPNAPWISDSENLTREEALRGITFWVALANKSYEKNGSLEVGKDADFVILNRDIMKVPQQEIKDAEVISTYINGEMVYEN
ncbi:MAG: amidohydrolase [Flavobacteriales bacterium]